MTIKRRWDKVLIFICALFFALVVNGAVPFFSMPTLGQAVWTTGFSQSFLNDSFFSVYARNFGAPEPAAISFGLAGAWPTAVFMSLGLHAADAYALMIALWLSVGFVSAYWIGLFFGVSPVLAILSALSWATMPVIWGHAGYSMMSAGISLLPLYFLAALHIFTRKVQVDRPDFKEAIKSFSFYLLVCLIAIFMDGYSFMMFAVGATLFGVSLFFVDALKCRRLFLFSFPIHFTCLAIAYLLFAAYIGKPSFAPAPIDFFRGWGVDATFLFSPTSGIHWLPDLLGWSISRSDKMFFGDASVWTTSFSFPVMLGAFGIALYVPDNRKIKVGLILVTVLGFYMALGPSLKINSVKPDGAGLGSLMAEQYAIGPTGSALLSKHLPGFKNMRASYRWTALGVFGAWALIVLAMSRNNKKTIIFSAASIIGIVTIFNLPDIPKKSNEYVSNREAFFSMESSLIDNMRNDFAPYEKVAFLPWRNDFLVNYAAARLDLVAFNIGGDKNLEEARLHWPKTMREFKMARIDYDFSDRILLLLARKEADVVVLPYIDMLRAAHTWPYPLELKRQLEPVMVELIKKGFVNVNERDIYSVVRLKPEFLRLAEEARLENIVRRSICMPPFCLKQLIFDESTPSRVGIIQNGRLVSTGKAGFVKFGPYVEMNEGTYSLVLRGEGNVSASAWVDVVSDKGSVQHGKFDLIKGNPSDRVLARGEVKLGRFVKDIEVRVYVSAEDDLALEGYELMPVSSLSQSSASH